MEKIIIFAMTLMIGIGCFYIQVNIISDPSRGKEKAQQYYALANEIDSGEIEVTKEKLVAVVNSFGIIEESHAKENYLYRKALDQLLIFIGIVLFVQLLIIVKPYVSRKNA